MVQEKSQTGALTCLRIPQHRQITIRVAKRQNWPPADVQGDVLGLHLAIIEGIEFGQLHQPAAALVHFEPQLLARADHLLARDVIDLLRACTHEIDTTASDDVGLEAVPPQEVEQLELRPVRAFPEQPPELGMPRLRQPVARDGLELLLPHTGMRGKYQLKDRLLALPHQSREVQLEQRFKGLAILERRVLPSELLHPIYEKKN